MLAVDVLLIFLTSACIIYCMLLNRRILELQKYRTEMQKLFQDFDKAVVKSETILSQTKGLLPEVQESMSNLATEAGSCKEELVDLVCKADKLAEELETIIISGNRLSMKLSSLNEQNNPSAYHGINHDLSDIKLQNEEISKIVDDNELIYDKKRQMP